MAVIDNGPRKGASPAAWQIVHDSPGLEDLWQLHYAAESDKDHNVADERIANVKENCEGKYIKVAARAGRHVHRDKRANRRAEDVCQTVIRFRPSIHDRDRDGSRRCGKTTVGRLLAEQLGWEFADADDFHPPSNVEKIRQRHRAHRRRPKALAGSAAQRDHRNGSPKIATLCWLAPP